jgi:hypothetical protein
MHVADLCIFLLTHLQLTKPDRVSLTSVILVRSLNDLQQI